MSHSPQEAKILYSHIQRTLQTLRMAASRFNLKSVSDVYAQLTRMTLRAEYLKLLQRFADFNGKCKCTDWTVSIQTQRDQFGEFQDGEHPHYNRIFDSDVIPTELEASMKTLDEIIEYEISEWEKAKKARIIGKW